MYRYNIKNIITACFLINIVFFDEGLRTFLIHQTQNFSLPKHLFSKIHKVDWQFYLVCHFTLQITIFYFILLPSSVQVGHTKRSYSSIHNQLPSINYTDLLNKVLCTRETILCSFDPLGSSVVLPLCPPVISQWMNRVSIIVAS